MAAHSRRMGDVRVFRVSLEVADPTGAGTRYGELFGTQARAVGGGRTYVDCGDTILALFPAQGAAPPSSSRDLYFEVGDIDAYYARAKRLGWLSDADIHGEPGGEIVVRPWGERSFYAQDPDGNGLCFVERGTIFTGQD